MQIVMKTGSLHCSSAQVLKKKNLVLACILIQVKWEFKDFGGKGDCASVNHTFVTYFKENSTSKQS